MLGTPGAYLSSVALFIGSHCDDRTNKQVRHKLGPGRLRTKQKKDQKKSGNKTTRCSSGIPAVVAARVQQCLVPRSLLEGGEEAAAVRAVVAPVAAARARRRVFLY